MRPRCFLGAAVFGGAAARCGQPSTVHHAGHELKLSIQIQVGADKAPPDDVVEQMNKILGEIKKGMRLE